MSARDQPSPRKSDKSGDPFAPCSKEAEPYFNEGGTARYPEGHTHRGHDVNALLDKLRGTSPPVKAETRSPK